MKLGLINSAWAQAGKGTAFGIRQTKAIGFDSIDIFADPLDTDAKERKLIRTECEKAGLPVVSVACVAVGLIDFNPSVQRFHVGRCQSYLDFAYELGARNVLLVLGGGGSSVRSAMGKGSGGERPGVSRPSATGLGRLTPGRSP